MLIYIHTSVCAHELCTKCVSVSIGLRWWIRDDYATTSTVCALYILCIKWRVVSNWVPIEIGIYSMTSERKSKFYIYTVQCLGMVCIFYIINEHSNLGHRCRSRSP